VRLAPTEAGAYRFRDKCSHVLYAGKALNLRNRLRSHIQRPDATPRHQLLMRRAAYVDWIVCPNDVEALLLEDMLIKKHRPPFNVRFRDDKRYPIIRLDVKDEYPSLSVVRKLDKDGALYFGPFTSGKIMHKILRVIERYFPLRKCTGSLLRKGMRECLNYQIQKCSGVCQGNINKTDYNRIVQQVHLLLSGRNDELIQRLERDMYSYAESLNFEAAALRRDQLEAVRNISGGRKLLLPRPVNIDVFAFDRTDRSGYGELLLIRSGILSGNVHLNLTLDQPTSAEQVAAHLMTHYYQKQPPVPDIVLSNVLPDSKHTIESWLKTLSGRTVRISKKTRGIHAKLIQLSESNLRLYKKTDQMKTSASDYAKALKNLLRLDVFPKRIEAVDISELQGKYVVASIVSFYNGKPEKSRYRRYKIRDTVSTSDSDRIGEVLKRRLSNMDTQNTVVPDLFLIDGGLLQFRAAHESVTESGFPNIPVVALVKARNQRSQEGLFMSGGLEITPDKDDAGLRFLDRIRDEAHRFAITYHRSVRDKSALKSELLNVKGVGSQRIKVLLKHFGSLEKIRAASISEISSVQGFGSVRATTVYNHFKDQSKHPGTDKKIPDTN
jgi:excinuclease ABC subunit C